MTFPSNPINFQIGNKAQGKTVASLDADVRTHLEELDKLLQKKITLPNATKAKRNVVTPANQALKILLEAPLSPKKVHAQKPWDNKSLLGLFSGFNGKGGTSFMDIIDKTPKLTQLYYNFQSLIEQNWMALVPNQRALFQMKSSAFIFPGTMSYLVSYAFYIHEIEDVNALMNFIQQNDSGTKKISYYITVSAARSVIDKQKLELEDKIDDDTYSLFASLAGLDISFASGTFRSKIVSTTKTYLYSNPYLDWINDWVTANPNTVIPEDTKPGIIQFIKSYNKANGLQIDADSIGVFIPPILAQLNGQAVLAANDMADDYEGDVVADEDFDVDFIESDQDALQVNVSNVKCAAQLYYSMILGDELDVFNVVNYFTHKYLVRGGMEIKDRRLREDLQMYVFSNKFPDLGTGREMERTRPAERMMFYKQVFNYGSTKVTDDLIVNDEFNKLWKVLILESAKYLERAQESPNPINFVSKQNVIQSVEDLQYNLSTHCTGMVNVITPIIYKELNFVIRRIFMHKEVMNQVVPSGGSWWRVVENLYASMRSKRMKTTVINSKAENGHAIIKAIADYNLSTFQNENYFSSFITLVDTFITTQSILQESLTDQVKKLDAGDNGFEDGHHDEMKPKKLVSAPAPVAAGGSDEWDF